MSVTLVTNHGPLKFVLYWKECPNACFNFLVQCGEGTYKGRKATVNGSKVEFKVKKPSVAAVPGMEGTEETKHLKGTVGLDQPHRCSFYIYLEARPDLDGRKVAFGRVAAGESQETLGKLASEPDEPVIVQEVKIHANPFATKRSTS